MYLPGHYAITDRDRLAFVLTENPFAILTTSNGLGVPYATHLPLLYRRDQGELGTLAGHMARANPQWKGFDGSKTALAVFQGPHGYVSPRWYVDRKSAPTWNYVAVHLYGVPKVIEGDAARAVIEEQVRAFEPAKEGWSMTDAPADYVAGMLRGLVAFEMPVSRIEHKEKLGQNRAATDVAGAARALRVEGNTALADLMDAVAAGK